LMYALNQGLTDIYNRFHDQADTSQGLESFRVLQAEMDSAVAASYGWEDINLGHGFHETNQGIRFTISESARREVLDRLLALNHQRHAEEVALGLHEKKSPKGAKNRKVSLAGDVSLQNDLFGLEPTVSIPAHQPGSDPSSIVEYLRVNAGWRSKDEILTATAFPENRWNVVIRELVDSGQVNRQGEKRGAKYRLADAHN
jgi:hypothetical protein